MPIRAAFFDIGNVLLRFSTREVLRKLAWALGRHPVLVAKTLWRENVIDQIERGKLSGEELHARFTELGYKGSWPAFQQLWCDHFTLDRGSYAILKATAEKVPTFLLSNTNGLHFEFIRSRYQFPSVVRGAILSHEVGLRKPEAAIFKKALELSGTKPAETVFIDDLEENCEGARKVGLVAIRFKGADDLKKRLAALGL